MQNAVRSPVRCRGPYTLIQEQYLLGCVVTAALQALLAMTEELSCKDAAP